MSSNELERQMRLDGLWNGVRDTLWAVFWTGAMGLALAIINHLERLPW